MIVSLYIGEDKLDLFKDETIELNSSVQDVDDITKNKTDFTKNFNVPASEINNLICKHYYDSDLDNGFDARTKVAGRIEIDGIVYKYGKFSLLGAKVKNGVPSSYELLFYGNLVSLVDILKNDELRALDLSAYNHEYNSANVLTGLQSGLFGGNVVYTLLAKKQYYYNSSSTDNTNTSTLSNIAFNGGGVNGVLWNDLRPSISLLPIIEAIETKYNLSFSRDFFGREEFTKLYLWLNRDKEKDTQQFTQAIDFDGGDSTWVNLTTDTGTFNVYTTNDFWKNKQFLHRLDINTFSSDTYKVKTYLNGVLFRENEFTGSNNLTYSNSSLGIRGARQNQGGTNYTLNFEIVGNENFVYNVSWENKETISTSFGFDDDIVTERTTTGSTQNILGVFRINNNLPQIKIIDFLKGLFSMFKLVVIQENNTDPIYINTLKDYYAAGQVWDITKFTNTNNYDVQRGNLLNQILYKFEDPSTLLNIQFKKNVGQGYGDEQLKLEDESGNPLDGGSQDYKVPFEQIVYERLNDLNDSGVETNIMYGAVIDESLEPANPKPHIHYVVNNPIGTKALAFINSSNVETKVLGNLNLPSHTLGFDVPEFSTVFGKEINEYSKEIIFNTLFSNYHADYIKSIFNFKRRTFKYESQLPLRIILKLKLNDVIQIGYNYFRINDYKYNLLTGKTSFNLINSFDNTINGFTASRNIINTDFNAKVESVYITGLTSYSFIITDLGFGTSWINSVSNVGSNVYFDIDQNNTAVTRSVLISFTNIDTLQTLDVTINQNVKTLTSDSNIIKADSNLITSDNG